MTDDAKQLISNLEAEYEAHEGFLGLLRAGHFDTRAKDRFLHLLAAIDLGSSEVVDRRLVSLLWYLPMFLQWQGRRLNDDERIQLQQVVDQVTNQLERILGVP